MSLTITALNGAFGSRNRLASSSRRGLLRIWTCQSEGSDAKPGITTFSTPFHAFGSESEFCKPPLVVNSNGVPVFHRAMNVVGVDVVAEDSASVLVGLLDRGPREPEEGGVWKCFPHVTREPVDEIVLAAVGFICE